MNIVEEIKAKARKNNRTVVLAEGTEERTVKASGIIAKEGLARIILLGDEKKIREVAAKVDTDLTGVTIVDPIKSSNFSAYAAEFYELRKKKGVTEEEAKKTMLDPLYYGTMMVYKNEAGSMLAGAQNTTGDVLRPAFQIVKTAPGISVVSGAFIMVTPKTEYGEEGILLFADCAVNPNPTAEQLAEIAYCTAKTAKSLLDIEPRVGMLSFSTKGSASHELVDKVTQATKIAQKRYPELMIDGELQADAAIVPKVGASKAPGSPVAGKCNVLVFPDLQSGNIGYKLVQRFAGAEAVGPVLQGMAKPINDLSRGCSVDDIVNTTAILACQG